MFGFSHLPFSTSFSPFDNGESQSFILYVDQFRDFMFYLEEENDVILYLQKTSQVILK